MRERLRETLQAMQIEATEDVSIRFKPQEALSSAAKERNPVAFRWYLKMTRKEIGNKLADQIVKELLATKHAGWVASMLKEA